MGVEVPHNKRIDIALRYIYGIGASNAVAILEKARIDPSIRAKDLNEQQLSQIVHAIQDGKYVIEGDLRREVGLNLKRLQSIKCYRGIRHLRGLPVRGQRTSTNARTRKGPRKTVGVQRNPQAKTGIH
jgi:small subunit ribosomal protein S13